MPYQQALEAEGYEDLESLTLMTEEEIAELSTAINMKAGHKKKFAAAILKARREMKLEEEEAQELAKIETEQRLAKAKANARQLHTDDRKDVDNTKAQQAKRSTEMPEWKDFAAFISHKKTHSKFGETSETLSIRLKV